MARKRHSGTHLRMRVEGRAAQARRHAATNATSAPSGGRLARFLRFMGSSIACTVIDQVLAGVLFILLRKPMGGMGFLRILVGTVIARVVSQTANYSLNHRVVFAGGGAQAQRPSRRESLPRFLAVASLVLALSTMGVYLLHTRFGIVEPIAKVAVDSMLFFLNYFLQRNWVFTTEPTISPRKAIRRRRR